MQGMRAMGVFFFLFYILLLADAMHCTFPSSQRSSHVDSFVLVVGVEL